ncbi:MAG: class B sortase [Lachnospiraceae bacterium]|nr:class B sortase [Lachnospiraceae bacterium]
MSANDQELELEQTETSTETTEADAIEDQGADDEEHDEIADGDQETDQDNQDQVEDDEDDADEDQDDDQETDEVEDDEDDDVTDAEELSRTGMPEMAPPLLVVCFVACIFISSVLSFRFGYAKRAAEAEALPQKTEETAFQSDKPEEETEIPVSIESEHEITLPPAEKLTTMQDYYEQNEDFIGWLKIDDMNIDYPVMQSPYDEEYYLTRDFNGDKNINGCLIMDTDSVVGTGTKANDYADGTRPSTNLIIHGHNMKNGDMFGNLDYYRDKKFGEEHKIIHFTTLYEEREYELISVFLSQVYLKTQTDVFKYYKFFQANSEEEFHDFYDHIKDMALYDTGVKASYGDEFITLSVCAYHVENGRLVVVGKRIK